MKEISKIIHKETFSSSFLILKKHLDEGDVHDVNLVLISEYIKKLSIAQIEKFYDRYVKTGLIYSVPELFSSDLVTVPKGIAGIREYRFFSSFSMVLYNSLGIFFSEMCSDIKDGLKFENRGVFSYTPTKYLRGSKSVPWKVNNEWGTEYAKFKKKLKEYSTKGSVVLQLDIASFFNSISHRKLVQVIDDFSTAQCTSKYGYDQNSEDILMYYLFSVIGAHKGLPQGKKNFASDYLAFLYLLKFDMAVQDLTSSEVLSFNAAVRYVDDIYIFFENKNGSTEHLIHKELSRIEHQISKWLYKELELSVNGNKTRRRILIGDHDIKNFLKESSKKISSPNKKISSEKQVGLKVEEFFEAIDKFRYPDHAKFGEDFFGVLDKEKLKNIFEPAVRSFLAKPDNIKELGKALDSIDFELTATNLDILIKLFYISQNGKRVYINKLENYLYKNFNPSDKRHIYIAFMARNVIKNEKPLKSLIKKNIDKLKDDDYGKYLVLYFFPKIKDKKTSEELDFSQRVYSRIGQEKDGRFLIRYPFFDSKNNHPFLPVIKYCCDGNNKRVDSLISALCGYVHERSLERWSLAHNKLQMVIHESAKILFGVGDGEKGSQVIDAIKKGGVAISTYEERDFLKFWDRRNFNPVSHGSKNGLSAPEVTEKELKKWETKISGLIFKMF